MHMVYNSENFVVVAFQLEAATADDAPGVTAPAAPRLQRGGFEIVDKQARKEIFIEGLVAEHFEQGVRALVQAGPNEQALDDFIGGFTLLAQQPVLMH